MSDEQHDPLPALIAELDQALAYAGQVARIARAHYEAFVEEGFSERQALYLASFYIRLDSQPPTE